jgi:RND family efflux transporter MFP subunit
MPQTTPSAPPASHPGPPGSGQRAFERRPRTDGTPESTGNGDKIDHGSNGHDEIDLNVPEPRPFWVVLAAIMVVVVLAVLLVTGFLPRRQQAHELAADIASATDAPVPVFTVQPRRSAAVVDLSIPGNLRPWQEVSIYARTSGYLKKFYVDISNQVELGQLMAEIDTPEIDQELAQAQATLGQVKASVTKAVADRELAKVTYDRELSLLQQKYISQQEADEKKAALDAMDSTLKSVQSNVTAAEAMVQRLTELQQFKNVKAPFAGVVSGRGYDVGSLITANPQATDIKPMYKIAENDVLRAFVNVPQSTALQIRKGMVVQIAARELPGRQFPGVVMGTTNYLDQASRSLLTEVKIQNVREPSGEFALLPGMYVTVNFNIHRDNPPLLIPGPALVANAEGTQVGVVKNGAVHFQKVVLGQDYGSNIEVVEGLTGDEQVIANPGERVVEGARVAATLEKSEPPATPTPATAAAPTTAPTQQKVAEAEGK